jgi:hypothetical protein
MSKLLVLALLLLATPAHAADWTVFLESGTKALKFQTVPHDDDHFDPASVGILNAATGALYGCKDVGPGVAEDTVVATVPFVDVHGRGLYGRRKRPVESDCRHHATTAAGSGTAAMNGIHLPIDLDTLAIVVSILGTAAVGLWRGGAIAATFRVELRHLQDELRHVAERVNDGFRKNGRDHERLETDIAGIRGRVDRGILPVAEARLDALEKKVESDCE